MPYGVTRPQQVEKQQWMDERMNYIFTHMSFAPMDIVI